MLAPVEEGAEIETCDAECLARPRAPLDEESFTEDAVELGCFLEGSKEYVPLQGNFDGAGDMDVLWYSPEDNIHVLWHDIGGMLSGEGLCADYASSYSIANVGAEGVGAMKPVVGDFDGNGIDDVLWYFPGLSVVWLFSPVGPSEIPLVSLDPPGEATPFVGDFNGDSCEDVLWYVPHVLGSTGLRGDSPVWRSSCDGTFIQEPDDVSTPGEAYPIGYNPRRGRGS